MHLRWTNAKAILFLSTYIKHTTFIWLNLGPPPNRVRETKRLFWVVTLKTHTQTLGTCTPLVWFFSFSCSFGGRLAEIIAWRPPSEDPGSSTTETLFCGSRFRTEQQGDLDALGRGGRRGVLRRRRVQGAARGHRVHEPGEEGRPLRQERR